MSADGRGLRVDHAGIRTGTDCPIREVAILEIILEESGGAGAGDGGQAERIGEIGDQAAEFVPRSQRDSKGLVVELR